MRNVLFLVMFLVMAITPAWADVPDDADGLYDSTSLVDTNSTTNTTSNVTSNNTNTNTNTNDTTVNSTSTSTNTNTNNNTVNQTVNSTSNNTNVNTNNNTNTNVNTTTSTNTNTNTNNTTIDQTTDSTINQTTNSTVDQTTTIDQNVESTNTNVNTNTNTNTSTNTNSNTNVNKNDSNVTQKIESPPASAIAPALQSGGNDTCTIAATGAVQTQILGISGGTHIRDLNCERIKNSKQLYNMGMKVAAVSLMCQDPKVFEAMMMAGTPCPYDGKIGEQAKAEWESKPEETPVAQEVETRRNDTAKGILMGILSAVALGVIL